MNHPNPNVCIFQKSNQAKTETFIHAHATELPAVTEVICFNNRIPCRGDLPVLSQRLVNRAARKLGRILRRESWKAEFSDGICAAIKSSNANVVLAEYGVIAVEVQDSCRRAGVPFVAHFHGYDASARPTIRKYATRYRKMFARAAAVIAVSRAMEAKLLELGCDRSKLVYNPYGINTERFCAAEPEHASPTFVAVGRFVDKKAPHLTLLAFAGLLVKCPEARLRMIGDGALLNACHDLARALQIDHAVTFLGAQPHDIVQQEMRRARAFIQHSVTAANGDSEGTPLAVLEAGASGLPVIATRHAGIPDVVVEGQTGLLVDERDINAMTSHMVNLANDPQHAGEMGRQAAARIAKYYTMKQSIGRLARVLDAAARGQDMDAIRLEIEQELPTKTSVVMAANEPISSETKL